MEYSQAEILQTVAMTEMEHLDVRTVTLGLSLRDCASESITRTSERVVEKIHRFADRLVETVDAIGDEFGIRIANKRIAITPVSMITEGASGDPLELARAIDDETLVFFSQRCDNARRHQYGRSAPGRNNYQGGCRTNQQRRRHSLRKVCLLCEFR